MMRCQSICRAALVRGAICLALIGMLCNTTSDRARAQGALSVTVPLIRHGVHIFVEATVNDKPALFGLDTGANENLLTPQAAKRLDLKMAQKQFNTQGAGNEEIQASTVKIGKLGVGTALLKAQSAYVVPLPNALECDGLLGTPFFERWVVQIDYAQLRLTLTPRPAFKLPAHSTIFPIRFYNGTPTLEATVAGIKGQFYIDTGADDAVTLFGPFVEQNHLRGKYLPSLQTVTGVGIGGLLYGDLVRLPEFGIGSFHFTRVTAELSRQTGGAFADKVCAGNLGGEIWQRFTLVLDYPDRVLFLTRNAHYEELFIENRAGLALDTFQSPALVRAVIPAGPAAEAGIHEGDVVLSIDGTPIDQIKPWDVSAIFRGAPGKKIVLHLRALDKTERDATLTLRDLL